MSQPTSVLSADDLIERYGDPETVRRIRDLFSLKTMLTDCIISNTYETPTEFVQSISLTEAGKRFSRRLREREHISHPTSHLHCLLALFGGDLLVDPNSSDLASIERTINRQIRNGSVRYGFNHGRLLYDKFFALHPREKSRLDLPETETLLSGTPQGVFQYDHFVVGPFGILRSESTRVRRGGRNPRLRHCSDVYCTTVHPVNLATSAEAEINRSRQAAARILDRERLNPDAWNRYFEKTQEKERSRVEEFPGSPVLTLIGDSFTDDEISRTLQWLLDNTRGTAREKAAEVELHGSAEQICRGRTRAELLQLIFTADDDAIKIALDVLVSKGELAVPVGEVRRPVLHRALSYGPKDLRAQLGPLGVRLVSAAQPLAPLRLRRLVEKIFDLQVDEDREELEWQLRGETADGLEAKIDRYVRNTDPRDVIERLVLGRRRNARIATAYVGLRDDLLREGQELVDQFMWKLGFPLPARDDVTSVFFDQHAVISEALRTSAVGPVESYQSTLRTAGSNYFPELEKVLEDSLSYTCWALLSDHVATSDGFSYRPMKDGQAAIVELNELNEEDSDESIVFLGEENNLYPLTRGFERLSALLRKRLEDRVSYERPKDDLPKWTEQDDLRKFPFAHTIPFLDLSPESQDLVIDELRAISRTLVAAETSELRNGLAHAKRSPTDVERLRRGVDAVREAVERLEANGFCRLRYTMTRRETDDSNRSKVVLTHPRAKAVEVYSPSPYDALGLPANSAPQYVMTSARFTTDTYLLRFTNRPDSPFTRYWEEYPKNQLPSTRSEMTSDSSHGSVESAGLDGLSASSAVNSDE